MHKPMAKDYEMAAAQTGAALIVSLILLLVLTLLAVSTMSTASLEVTMAGNDQYAENAFQLAETGIDRHVAEAAATCVDTGDGADDCDFLNEPVGGMNGSFSTEGIWLDEGPCPGPYSIGEISSFNFQVTATGTTNNGATSTHTIGWYVCR